MSKICIQQSLTTVLFHSRCGKPISVLSKAFLTRHTTWRIRGHNSIRNSLGFMCTCPCAEHYHVLGLKMDCSIAYHSMRPCHDLKANNDCGIIFRYSLFDNRMSIEVTHSRQPSRKLHIGSAGKIQVYHSTILGLYLK